MGDDVSVVLGSNKTICPQGHPYTPELCSRPEIKQSIKQLKLDLKVATIMYQEVPVFTNPGAKIAFEKILKAEVDQATVLQDAEKLMNDFGGHFTIEGSYQDKEGVFQSCCDFQGCETNDWAEGMSAQSAARAFVAMTKFLHRVKNDHKVKDIVKELLETLKTWPALESSSSQAKRSLNCFLGLAVAVTAVAFV